ncbi:hypothetical protein VTH8203_01348 [Vibrio thalassae]|uniref:Uncharacterized protein n=1 Tax=Vibrio thalassae TaxID=1243014 RepID=A0A240EHJ2_9VIBR|nr:hypothetical protein [Vibrio thalassae]SNX47733.1 hypothetical protein VTH8203_01348 [Vibrio thalassae]
MKRKVAYLLLLALPNSALAYTHQSLKVITTQTINAETGNSDQSFTVDGLEITLSEKDKRLAKNWNLSHGDWAKYKYIIEYTPRGTWTPDLDPPIVLGNYATTEEERMHYARKMNEIELARRDRELAFQDAAIRAIYQSVPSVNPNIPKPKTGIAARLTEGRTTLRSLFIDYKTCDSKCKIFSTLAIATSPSDSKLDIHMTNATGPQAEQFLSDIGVTENKKQQKAISVNASLNNHMVEKHRNGGTVPYYLVTMDTETKRFHSQ